MNIGDVIARTYRVWLSPPDEQPARFNVTAPVDAVTETLPVDLGLLSAEEQFVFDAGVLVEVDRELMFVVSRGESTLTVLRGQAGTDPAAHDAGLAVVAPDYPRETVFEAIGDAIVGLWPTLWAVRTEILSTGGPWVQLPSDTMGVTSVQVNRGGHWPSVSGWRFEASFPFSPTGKALTFPDCTVPETALVTARVKPARPDGENDEVTDLGVRDEWAKLLTVAAAAHLVANVDVKATTAEFITSTLAREGVPIESASRVRNALLQYRQLLLDDARRALDAEFAPEMLVTGAL